MHELVGPGSPRYLELEHARTRMVDVEEGSLFSRGPIDASRCAIEIFSCLELRAPWMVKAGARGRHWIWTWTSGLWLSFEDEVDDFGSGWDGAVFATMMDFHEMFSRPQGTLVSCTLRQVDLERRAESGRPLAWMTEWLSTLSALL